MPEEPTPKPIPEPTETAPAQDSALPPGPPPKRERPLTLKQQKWIDAYIANGGNATEAARLAGYDSTDYKTLSVIGTENLAKLRPKLEDILDKHGLTLDSAAAATAQALQANTVKTASEKGKITDEREYADYPTRLAAARQVFQLRGAFKEGSTVNVNVNYGVGAIELDPEFDAIDLEIEGE